MSNYSYKPAYRGPRKVPAQLVAMELARLDETGGISASRVVDAARALDAPLHPEFEWDDPKAAEEYRLSQARLLIRAIEVIIVSQDAGQPKEVYPAYVHVPARHPNQEGLYVSSATLADNADQFQRALGEALRYLESAEKAVHFLRRLVEDTQDSVAAQVAVAHEGFHLIRDALEGLKAS